LVLGLATAGETPQDMAQTATIAHTVLKSTRCERPASGGAFHLPLKDETRFKAQLFLETQISTAA